MLSHNTHMSCNALLTQEKWRHVTQVTNSAHALQAAPSRQLKPRGHGTVS